MNKRLDFAVPYTSSRYVNINALISLQKYFDPQKIFSLPIIKKTICRVIQYHIIMITAALESKRAFKSDTSASPRAGEVFTCFPIHKKAISCHKA